MAIMTIRSTFAFDPRTVEEIDELSRNWQVSKSEAVRLAIHRARETILGKELLTPAEAFRRLQQGEGLPPGTGVKWMKEIRKSRDLES